MMIVQRLIPRFRITIKSAMLFVALVALIMSFVVGPNPIGVFVYTYQLYETSDWCSSGVHDFLDIHRWDQSVEAPVPLPDHFATSSVPCLIKLAYVHSPRYNGADWGCDVDHVSVAVDGRRGSMTDIFSYATQGAYFPQVAL